MEIYTLRDRKHYIINTFDNLHAAIQSICLSYKVDSCKLSLEASFSYDVTINNMYVANIWLTRVLSCPKQEVMN